MNGNILQYSFSNRVYMFFCFIRTKLFYRNARLIRFPFDIRNARDIELGKNFTCGRGCRIEVCYNPGEEAEKKIRIKIGTFLRIGDYVHIACNQSLIIGDNVRIGSKTYISDINHGNYDDNTIFDVKCTVAGRPLISHPVIIGNDVWLGESVCVLPGVTIGDGAIVGALSCVTKSIPPYSIAVGNPARIVKQYNFLTKCWERIK